MCFTAFSSGTRCRPVFTPVFHPETFLNVEAAFDWKAFSFWIPHERIWMTIQMNRKVCELSVTSCFGDGVRQGNRQNIKKFNLDNLQKYVIQRLLDVFSESWGFFSEILLCLIWKFHTKAAC